MKPWMGVAAIAAAMLVSPTAALADDDAQALLKFRLDSSAQYDDFERLGFAMDHGVDDGNGDDKIVSAWVNDEELAIARAHGFESVGVVHSKENFAAIRAESLRVKQAEIDAKRALGVNKAGKAGASAAPGSVRVQRAEYFENNVGKFISIEANADGVTYTGTNGNIYNGPTLMAEFYDAAGNRLGGGPLDDYTDTDVNPDYYQYHWALIRYGNKGDSKPTPASVKVSSDNGDVDTLATKEWIAKDPPKPPVSFQTGFVNRYYDSPDAIQKIKDIATQYPNITTLTELPNKTHGYQRPAATMLGFLNTNTTAPNATTPYVRLDASNLPVAGSAPATAQIPRTVVITSKVMGHLGGNSLTAQIVPPTANNQALSVTLTGNALRVMPATNATGAVTSTANDVIAAINAHPQASTVVRATKYRTSATAGTGIVEPSIASPLSDLLRAPATVPRGPQTQYVLRIGKVRDGVSKVGVYLYCQEHAGEIATSGVCLETAERLVRNYGTDPQTTALVDGLEIFIVPQINSDGVNHSIYDSPRRTNMAPYCYDPASAENLGDPANRNNYGININRNFSVGSIFDGFQGASTGCSGGNTAGLFELSEPETMNEVWVQNTFRNVKFSNNIHSSGGYFMWPPGSYTPGRVPLPYPPYGTLNFFDQAAKHVLDGIKSHRGLAIRPQRTGPVIDVLYSAAGNSADEAYYTLGIIGYDFEIGDTNYYVDPVTGVERTCGAGQQPPFGDSTNDCLDNEGFHEAMEFSSGNYGLMQSALDYSNDTTPPVVDTVVASEGKGTYEVRFKSNEASSIYYTLDGSTPTTASTEYKPPRARALPLPVIAAPGVTVKWIAHDFKGNMSAVKSQVLGQTQTPGTVGGTVPATLSLTIGQASFGAFVPGVARTYTASTMANVISTAGDALLSVSDPSTTATGRLVNGAFSLANPVQARVAPTALANVGGSAAPTPLKSWTAPTSNEAVAVDFSQSIGANEALRTGSYSKTLTFTLSTTQP